MKLHKKLEILTKILAFVMNSRFSELPHDYSWNSSRNYFGEPSVVLLKIYLRFDEELVIIRHCRVIAPRSAWDIIHR